ncbi:MAG: hypothetical protein R3F59_10030 [Myxococcota bacterium]
MARMNGALADREERWETLSYPVPTSSTEVIVDAVGCVGTRVETWMGFEEARRRDAPRGGPSPARRIGVGVA